MIDKRGFEETDNACQEALVRARRLLRQMQGDDSSKPSSVLPAVMEALAAYREFENETDEMVVRGGYKYPRALELERISLAEELARRVEPGPFEEPARFAALAYAAASIDLAMPDAPGGIRPFKGWDQTLLATVQSSQFNSGYGSIDESGYAVIFINSALIDLVGQFATATNIATAVLPKPGTSASEKLDPLHVADAVRHYPGAADQLYAALEAYIYQGRPRASTDMKLEPNNLAVRTLLSMAYRWVLGHEYGHGFVADRRNQAWSVGQREELIADVFATIRTAFSAVRLDGLPPELGPVGGAFFLTCHELLDRAVAVATTGEEVPGVGDAAHPSSEARVIALINSYGAMVEAESGPDGINLAIRSELAPPHPNDAKARELRGRILGHAHALFSLWSQVKPRLLADFEAKRSVHSTWK